MKYYIRLVVYLYILIWSGSSLSEENLVIKKDIIKGNSELPKVMYIIPWQSTVTETKFKGVKLHNYYETLLQPFHPHRVDLK